MKATKTQLNMHHFIFSSPIGNLCIYYEDDQVRALFRTDEAEGGERNGLTELVKQQLLEYFAGTRRTFDFPYELKGTPFQLRVWHALCDIPYGETRTYAQIASTIGNPRACRAVGMANHNNPIAIAVPCHRVVGADGSLIGYAGGLDMKRFLLDLENVSV